MISLAGRPAPLATSELDSEVCGTIAGSERSECRPSARQPRVAWSTKPIVRRRARSRCARLRKSEGGRGWAAADSCFQRSCLQPNGSQLAIRPALLLATSATAAQGWSRPEFVLAQVPAVRSPRVAPSVRFRQSAAGRAKHVTSECATPPCLPPAPAAALLKLVARVDAELVEHLVEVVFDGLLG